MADRHLFGAAFVADTKDASEIQLHLVADSPRLDQLSSPVCLIDTLDEEVDDLAEG